MTFYPVIVNSVSSDEVPPGTLPTALRITYEIRHAVTNAVLATRVLDCEDFSFVYYRDAILSDMAGFASNILNMTKGAAIMKAVENYTIDDWKKWGF